MRDFRAERTMAMRLSKKQRDPTVFIYGFKDAQTGEMLYVGQTDDLKSRERHHRTQRERAGLEPMPETGKFVVLRTTTHSRSTRIEHLLITKYQSIGQCRLNAVKARAGKNRCAEPMLYHRPTKTTFYSLQDAANHQECSRLTVRNHAMLGKDFVYCSEIKQCGGLRKALAAIRDRNKKFNAVWNRNIAAGVRSNRAWWLALFEVGYDYRTKTDRSKAIDLGEKQRKGSVSPK